MKITTVEIKNLLREVLSEMLSEDENVVKAATFTAKNAIVKQRDAELHDKEDSLKIAKEKERIVKNPEEKQDAIDIRKDLESKVKSARLNKKASEDERRSATK